MPENKEFQRSPEQYRNTHARERNEGGIEKRYHCAYHSFNHATLGPGRMEIDRDSCNHMLSILIPKKSSDDGHECCQTPYQVCNTALQDAAASFGICKYPCLLHFISCSIVEPCRHSRSRIMMLYALRDLRLPVR